MCLKKKSLALRGDQCAEVNYEDIDNLDIGGVAVYSGQLNCFILSDLSVYSIR